MPNIDLLRAKINESGMTVTAITEKAGFTRETFYNRMAGKSDFKASEITALTRVLRLTKKERDDIFLT